MFRSILPSSKRSLSSDSVPSEGDLKTSESMPSMPTRQSGKENRRELGDGLWSAEQKTAALDGMKTWSATAATSKVEKRGISKTLGKLERATLLEANAVHQAFEKMLDDMQIPGAIRPKLDTLDAPVKAAMLRSSQTLTLFSATSPPPSQRTLRKTRSSESLTAQLSALSRSPAMLDLPVVPATPVKNKKEAKKASPLTPSSPFMHVGPEMMTDSQRRPVSMDMSRAISSTSIATTNVKRGSKSQSAFKEKGDQDSPEALAAMLANTRSTALEVDKVKKLRLLLRNEAASWTEFFLFHGGYVSLLARLKELLEVEWREEQHDDQVLHELLRCLKALSTSAIGCFALRSACPMPFAQLMTLMYSDKKPGDLCTRQLIVDLLLILFELYPARASAPSKVVYQPGAAPHTQGTPPSARHRAPIFPLPVPHTSLYSLARALLLTTPPTTSEPISAPLTPHAFISSLHVPRIFKPYLAELSDICRDYFWVFCHTHNAIWALEEVDEGCVEKPRAPGGMTGGVEFEAVGYLTTHLRLINALSRSALDLNIPRSSEYSAHTLHVDLFASGLERILTTIRKGSITYYPTMHLEIGRYISLCRRAGFELPWSISRLIGSPPAAVRKAGLPPPVVSTVSPTRRSGVGRPPTLPITPRLDALNI